MKHIRHYIVIGLLGMALTGLRAQYASVKRYTVNDGLPQTEVQNLMVDRSGLLHLSFLGVNKSWIFDGFHFYEDKHSMQTDHIFEDPAGRIWFSNLDQLGLQLEDSLLTWNFSTDETPADTLWPGKPGIRVAPIDRPDKQFFFSTVYPDAPRLYTFQPACQCLISVDRVNNTGSIERGTYIYADTLQDRYLLSTRENNRSVRYRKSGEKIERVRAYQPTSNPLGDYPIKLLPNGDALYLKEGYFFRWVMQTGVFERMAHLPPLQERLPIKELTWESTSLKANVLLFTRGRERYLVDIHPDLSDYTITRFYFSGNILEVRKDAGGTYWAVGHSGLIRIFPYFTNFFNEQDPELLTDVHAIVEDPKGNMWIGSYGHGMGYVRPDDQFVHIGNGFERMLPGAVLTESGSLLFSSAGPRPDRGLLEFQGGTSKLVYPDLLGYYFTRDRAGSLLFGSNKHGLLIHKDSISGFGPDSWEAIGPEKGFRLGNVLTAFQDQKERYWMARPSTGMAVYLPERDTVLNFLLVDEQIDLGVMSSLIDPKGNIWLGTTRGLYRFHPPDVITPGLHPEDYMEKVELFLPRESTVFGMTIYQDRYLAVSIGATFALLDLENYPKKPEHPWIFKFDRMNGHHGQGGEQNALQVDSRQRIWWANDVGVSRFEPSLFTPDTATLKAVIDELSFYGSNLVDRADKKIMLEEKNNEFQVRLHLENNQHLTTDIGFLYQLNNDSMRYSDKQEINFETKAFGLHTLTIYPVRYGVRQPPTSIEFRVFQPFLQSPWAYALLLPVLVLLGSMIWWIVKRRRREIDQLQAQIIASQLNPHFINNALGWVQLRASVYNDNDAVEVIENIAENIRMIFSNSRKQRAYHTLEEELKMIENYFLIQKTRFGADFAYRMPGEAQLEKINLRQYIPLMILQIHCENAIEHGIRNLSGKGYITLDILDQPDEIRIVIEDNGIGRKKAAELGSFGFGQGTKIIAELIVVFNRINKRQIVHFYEDDIFTDTQGNVYGTRSVFLIPKNFNFESRPLLPFNRW